MAGNDDPFRLARFLEAQEETFDQALCELRGGRKRLHWMWFIFPQIDGLGTSPTARRFAITTPEEARAYLAHPVLGQRLVQCSEALLRFAGTPVSRILPPPDDLKLRSSMTLFELVAPEKAVFARVLHAFYDGVRDATTLELASEPGARKAPSVT